MAYKITHITNYEFNKTVFLEPHTFRLIPRTDPYQKLIDFSIQINPKEAGLSNNIDLDGNSTITAWFDDMHDSLQVKTTSIVEINNTNPFNYIITNLEAIKLPFKYSKEQQKQLSPFIILQEKPSKKLVTFAKKVQDDSDNETIKYISTLCSSIHSTIEKIDRETGNPYAADITLKKGKGSCRDLAVLFMDCCRLFGLASRFVSGYLATGHKKGEVELHAWAEVYIPGAGWKGYDPSTGFSVSNDHIAIASGCSSQMASPVSGYFRGNNAETKLSFDITIKSDSQ